MRTLYVILLLFISVKSFSQKKVYEDKTCYCQMGLANLTNSDKPLTFFYTDIIEVPCPTSSYKRMFLRDIKMQFFDLLEKKHPKELERFRKEVYGFSAIKANLYESRERTAKAFSLNFPKKLYLTNRTYKYDRIKIDNFKYKKNVYSPFEGQTKLNNIKRWKDFRTFFKSDLK